jgi:hypothetical protein
MGLSNGALAIIITIFIILGFLVWGFTTMFTMAISRTAGITSLVIGGLFYWLWFTVAWRLFNCPDTK